MKRYYSGVVDYAMIPMKVIRIELSDENYRLMVERKGRITWRAVLERGFKMIDEDTLITKHEMEYAITRALEHLEERLNQAFQAQELRLAK